MKVNWIREMAGKKQFQLTEHAHKERQEEAVELKEIREALMSCETLEDYPHDPRGASCLALGYSGGKPIHIVCGQTRNEWLLVVTVYTPKPPKWTGPRTRAKRGDRNEA